MKSKFWQLWKNNIYQWYLSLLTTLQFFTILWQNPIGIFLKSPILGYVQAKSMSKRLWRKVLKKHEYACCSVEGVSDSTARCTVKKAGWPYLDRSNLV